MPDRGEATFYFRASTLEGGMLAGEIPAANEHEALRKLRAGGYIPIRLETAPIEESLFDREIIPGRRQRLTDRDCETICRELALLLESGLDLAGSLSLLTDSLPRRAPTRRFAQELRQWLRIGFGFAESVRRTRFVVPPDLLPAIEAGERSAELVPALVMLADRLREAVRLRRMVSQALAYPLLLLVIAFAAVAILAFFVAPSLAGLFEAMDKPVPLVIAVLNAVQSGLRANAALALCSFVGLAIALGLLARQRGTRQALKAMAARLPVLGPALSWAAAGRFAATLRLFLVNSVPLSSALPSAYAAAGLSLSPAAATRLVDEVRRGETLSAVLDRSAALPPKVVHLIRVGEANARVSEVLSSIAEEARQRFEQQLALLSSLLAPLLIVFVGSLVGWIIFTVFSALLGINDLAS